MSESNLSEYGPKDPVRIVYHTGNRTFARIFNERSLDEVKDVVRRKLGLGSQTNMSLKQMGHDILLDLDDDDDFQAFRILLKSCVSVDIRVTVGESQGSPVSAPAARTPREHPSTSKPTETPLPISPPKGPLATIKPPEQPVVQPEVARTADVSSTPAKKSGPVKRKRKVSFDKAGAAVPSVASTKTAESTAASKPVASEEPPKKKQKRESTKKTKTADTQTIQTAEGPAMTTSAPKHKAKKLTALDPSSNAETGMAPAESSEPLEKKPKKVKKDGSTKKSAASGDRDGTTRPSELAEAASLQLGDVGDLRVNDWTKAPKGMICASIPQTSASTTVQSEVSAAIISGLLCQASKTILPDPPAKRKSVKREPKKPVASSRTSPAVSETVLDAPDNEINIPTEQSLGQVALTNKPIQRTADLDSPPCLICLGAPFHIRYCCPTVLKGPDAIRKRLEEIRKTNRVDQQSLIKQLEGLLRDPKVSSGPLSGSASTDGLQSRTTSPLPSATITKTPNVPGNSYVSEVAVESKDEGSSSEGSDDTSQGEVEQQEGPGFSDQVQRTPEKEPVPTNGDLEAIVRGPTSKGSVLHIIDRIAGAEDEEGSDSEEDKAELEEDPDEEAGRSRHLSYRRVSRSSESESEEESMPPSPSVPDEHLQSDDAVKPSNDFPVPDVQDDDSSEETHVGSEDRMVIDESTGEKEIKGAIVVAENEHSSLLQPWSAPGDEPQGSAETGSFPNWHSRVPAATRILEEAAADPIESADDSAPAILSPFSIIDPIEAPPGDIGPPFASAPSSTPKPGVSKRLKTRNGQIPAGEIDQPVLLDQLTLESMNAATPIPSNGKSRRKVTETPASQEPARMRKGAQRSSVPLPTSTPAASVLLNHRSGTGKAAKTPAKQSGEQSDTLKSTSKDNATRDGTGVAATPSLVVWETLGEPSSPSAQPDDRSILVDELMSSSPHPEDGPPSGRPNGKGKRGRPSKAASSGQAESSQGKQRLFDLSSSQVPFPYSQNLTRATVATPPKESDESTGSDDEPKVVKKTKTPARYRTLSQLASEASTFVPTFPTPTPTHESATKGEAKKRAVEEEESSSSSSDADEANGSMHIPPNRRAGSFLEKKEKKKGLFSGR